jgi:hypothetical protein
MKCFIQVQHAKRWKLKLSCISKSGLGLISHQPSSRQQIEAPRRGARPPAAAANEGGRGHGRPTKVTEDLPHKMTTTPTREAPPPSSPPSTPGPSELVLTVTNPRCLAKFWSTYKAKDKTCRVFQ